MSDGRHKFSAFDAWVIDLLATMGVSGFVTAVVTAWVDALFPDMDEERRGPALAGLLIVLFIGLLVYLRKIRSKRDAADESGAETATRRRAR